MPRTRPFIPTRFVTKNSLRQVVGLDFFNLQGFEGEEIEDEGVERAIVEKIKFDPNFGDIWEVKTFSGRREFVQMSSDYGIQWMPEGEEKNGIFYPSETVIVELAPDAYGNGKRIISTFSDPGSKPEPGATVIVRGESKILVFKDRIEIETPKLIINGEDYDG